MQEREYTDEDRALQDEVLEEDQPDRKRKDESQGDESPEKKRRRTQEQEDWYDDFWSDKDKSIGLVE
eukprot:6090282-Karenia_brevis.AAC.1